MIKPRFFRCYIALITFSLIVYCIIIASSKSRVRLATGFGPNTSGRRRASIPSAFRWIESRRKHVLEMDNEAKNSYNPLKLLSWASKGITLSEAEKKLLLNIEDAPLDKKCRYMVDALYMAEENWTNQLITQYHENEKVNDILTSSLGERMRLFDYCFLSGGLNVKDVMDMENFVTREKMDGLNSSEDFIQRMFPFLKKSDLVWPKIYNLRKRTELEPPAMEEGSSFVNFWNNWIKSSKGKGIALTLTPSEIELFHRQLKVLSKLNNTLPVQVITSGFEFAENEIDQLSKSVIDTDQSVTLVDCSSILDKEFTENYIQGSTNKWLVALFNTFAEVILLDVDTVPFIHMEKFFNESQYQDTGMALFKDRAMANEHTYSYCTEQTFMELEPSHEENKVMGTKLMFESTQTELPETEAAAVYQRFFHDKMLHHVESGLVPLKKIDNFGGLLFSFMINLSSKIRRCVHGDKEFFWLGQLYAGKAYTIYPQDAGVVGFTEATPMEALSQYSHTICGSQLAHTFHSSSTKNHQLVWTNGGLSTCKMGPEKDFENSPDYFMARYGAIENARQVYTAPVHIQAMIIPDRQRGEWSQLNECNHNAFCASVVEDTEDARNNIGTLIQFTPEEQEFLDSISFTWNGRTFIGDQSG